MLRNKRVPVFPLVPDSKDTQPQKGIVRKGIGTIYTLKSLRGPKFRVFVAISWAFVFVLRFSLCPKLVYASTNGTNVINIKSNNYEFEGCAATL